MQLTRLGPTALIAAVGLVTGLAGAAAGQPASPDDRARATEAQMTDDERFALIISLLGNVADGTFPSDPRIPAEVKNHSAGYTAGIPRLGVPALQSSDASMGITNPGYRPDDKGATAFPASIVMASSFNPALAREQGVRMRLLGFERVELKPGESKTVTVKADPRLLAKFDGQNGLGRWRLAEGRYRVGLGRSAGDLALTAETSFSGRAFGS
jgi:hypothetical protein